MYKYQAAILITLASDGMISSSPHTVTRILDTEHLDTVVALLYDYLGGDGLLAWTPLHLTREHQLEIF